MRHLYLRISGRLATLGLVIAVVALLLVQVPAPAASFDNVRWTLTSLEVNGQVYAVPPNAPVTLTVTLTFHVQDRTITGRSGINAYQATYQRLNAWIRFLDVAITLALCACPLQNVYLQALMQAETLLVSGTSMTITGAGGQDLLRYTSS